MTEKRKALAHKARKLRAFFFDVDGTLTDGTVTIDHEGNESMTFSKRDGLGLRMLMDAGLKVGLITGSDSPAIMHRFFYAPFDFCTIETGVDTSDGKLAVIKKEARKHGFSLEECGYMGDDLNDLACLDAVGFRAAPGDGEKALAGHIDIFSTQPAGRHAVRDICNFILACRKEES